jgi:hypothetical protein
MFLLALLPLLALPAALGGLAEREPRFLQTCGSPDDSRPRLSYFHYSKSSLALSSLTLPKSILTSSRPMYG